jgi:nitrous oxidase accessory protein
MDLKGVVGLFIVCMLMVVSVVNGFSFLVLGQIGLVVHNLDTGLSYASIQEAVGANETLDGHTIFVDAGFYRENVVVFKSVSLVAAEGFGVVVDGGGNGTVISVVADGVNITGFVVQNSGLEPGYFGVFLNRSSRCVISNNIVRQSYYGAHLYYSHDSFIVNNTFSNCSYGVWLAYSERNLLLNNIACNNKYVGFHLYPSNHNILRGNEVWNNEHGIYIYFSTNNTLLENRVYNNTFGTWFSGGVNNTVYKNVVFNNTNGGSLTASSGNFIAGNSFDGNGLGISLRDGSDNNLVFHNNFLNNTRQARSVKSANFFDNGVEGNYWMDYDGFDINNDGIGDKPYLIEENNTDQYPLMGKFFGFSTVLEGEQYNFHIISNCSIYGFEFLVEVQTMKFRVSGLNGTVCFCRLMFPRFVLAGPYIVVVDGVEVDKVLLPVSDVSSVFLYIAFNVSDHEVVVASKPFYSLLESYNTLMKAYSSLLANYTMLWSDYHFLNASYSELLGNYTNLQRSLDSLQAAYDLLNSSYNNLVASYEAVEAELENVRLLMYSFLATTVIGAIVSVVSLGFGFRYYKRFSEQKRIIEGFGLSPLDVAQALFELDVRRRAEKIERFEEKYGVKIRPRVSLEDIIESLKSRKERRRG